MCPTNEYYDSTGYPSTGAAGSSASMRAEFDAIEAGFVKLPTMAGNGGEPVFVNAGGTALETKSIADTQTALGLPAMAGNGGETVFVNAGGTALETKSAADTITAIGAESASNKDVSGGYAGLTLLKINFKNVLNTITSFFTNSNTVARTYTFPDKDGTVAMTSDLLGVGQTWQNVTASREYGTVYQNTTGVPISVAADCSTITGQNPSLEALVGSLISDVSMRVGLCTIIGSVNFIVPPGWYYKINAIGTTKYRWVELR